jgi:hypothetical protein
MTRTRNVFLVTLVVLAVVCSALFLAWMEQLQPKYPADYGAMLWEGISITDVQFGSGCLRILVTNPPPEYCTVPVKITSVTISNLNKNTSVTIPVNETIPVGTQREIRINYEWTFRSTYNIVLNSARGCTFNCSAVAPPYTNHVEVISSKCNSNCFNAFAS